MANPTLTRAPVWHTCIGLLGFFVSGFFPDTTVAPPIDIGNKQLQQISVMGLMKRPEQLPLAKAGVWEDSNPIDRANDVQNVLAKTNLLNNESLLITWSVNHGGHMLHTEVLTQKSTLIEEDPFM